MTHLSKYFNYEKLSFYDVPSEGITLTFYVHIGGLTVYGSAEIPNPNELFYDFQIF